MKRADHLRESPQTVLDQAVSSCLFALQLLALLEDFDSHPALQWSPDVASEQPLPNLPSNREPLLSLVPQASHTCSAWQQPVRQKTTGIEATFTPTAVGLRPDQLPASRGDLISEAIKQGIAVGL